MLEVRLMTERCEMWSISAGRVVNRFPCALSILRLVQEPISRGNDSWKKSNFKAVFLGNPALYSGIQIANLSGIQIPQKSTVGARILNARIPNPFENRTFYCSDFECSDFEWSIPFENRTFEHSKWPL